MSGDEIQNKIQKLELETIRAVTELQKDVQVLTKEVVNLTAQIQKMSENYITAVDHNEDIANVKSNIALLSSEIKSMKRKTWIQNTLSAVAGGLLVFLVNYYLNHLGV